MNAAHRAMTTVSVHDSRTQLCELCWAALGLGDSIIAHATPQANPLKLINLHITDVQIALIKVQ